MLIAWTFRRLNFSNYDLFSTWKINSSIKTIIRTMRCMRSTNAATKSIISTSTFWIKNCAPFLTISSSMLSLASTSHFSITKTISPSPSVSYSSSILWSSTKQPLIRPSTWTVGMTIYTKPWITWRTFIIA